NFGVHIYTKALYYMGNDSLQGKNNEHGWNDDLYVPWNDRWAHSWCHTRYFTLRRFVFLYHISNDDWSIGLVPSGSSYRFNASHRWNVSGDNGRYDGSYVG